MLTSTGSPLQTLVTRTVMAENLVTLKPHGQAWFVIQYPNTPAYSGQSCPTSGELAVAPPGTTETILVKGRAGAVAPYGAECGQIDVQPVTPKGVPLSP